ncbi:hypothetical protein RHGRI_018033 [Rhododendron griersonianum]|uniref:F-box associated beta-propeller type 3 domain-containing protein n=1 Tax=Rhododendron griersonianum TaxID=479676 RepID=A0AAV6K023_9ERIC|nr:hypothetical protein RHGRI_018033 [Rhododendron griersonianum]
MFRILGSCNGLLCLHHGTVNYGIMFVINPCTRKRIEIPEMIDWPFGVHMVIGFGFSPKRNEYKVVKVIGASGPYVFNLSEGVWREVVGAPSFKIVPYSESYVCVNGVIHWTSVYGSNSILCFDVADEVFDVIPCPASGLQCGQVFLALFSGCLGVIEYDYGENNCFDIWVMKDYNVRELWTKSFIINMNHIGWYGGYVEGGVVQLGAEVGDAVEDSGVEDETGVLFMRGGVIEMGFDQGNEDLILVHDALDFRDWHLSRTTLPENNLKEIKGGVILESQAVLVASRKSLTKRKVVLNITHEKDWRHV